MISTITKTNNELTRHVIRQFHSNNMPINELVLQKVMYKIKMDLGENHPLWNSLPYYWYCYGPFSETVRQSFLDVKPYLKPVGDGFLIDDSSADAFVSSADFSQTDDIVSDLIGRGDYVYSSLAEDIYRQFAPMKLLHTFRYGIFNPTESDHFSIDGDDYIKLFRYCQRKIPKIPYFQDYAIIFTNFAMQIDCLNDSGRICDNWNLIKKPVRSLWFCFAQGLRCLEHDNYYDNRFNQWNSIFNKSLIELDIKINDFLNSTTCLIDFSKYSELTGEERNFISSLIDIYVG